MPRIPSYRLHKASGQAVVTLRDSVSGKTTDVYLGQHGTVASRAQYAEVLGRWEAAGRRVVDQIGTNDGAAEATVAELTAAYFAAVEPRVSPGEARGLRGALDVVDAMFGHTLAREFGPLRLQAVRDRMVERGWKRLNVNKQVGRIQRAFRWGVSQEMVPVGVHAALKAVQGLRRGETSAPESEPVLPVDMAHVRATMPHLSRPLRAVVDLQRLTGARPGEILQMRPCDIEKDAMPGVWLYRPAQHKNAHRGRGRIIMLGPDAQNIVRQFLDRPAEHYLFNPAESEAERKGSKQPVPNRRYQTTSMDRAIANACKANGIPHWHPHQIRHTVGTEVRAKHGLEAAKIFLGHSSAIVTDAVYAERDMSAMAAIALERS